MLLLVLIWLVIGLLLGALGCGARLRRASWGKRGWLAILGIGMVSTVVGGWLGAWLFGSQFATVTALWVGVMGVGLLPWLFTRKTNNARPRPVEHSRSKSGMSF